MRVCSGTVKPGPISRPNPKVNSAGPGAGGQARGSTQPIVPS